MIQVTQLDDNIFKIKVSGKLEEGDLQKIGPDIDQLAGSAKKRRLLVDATEFNGWVGIHTIGQHFTFMLRDHHNKIERIAFITSNHWHYWVVTLAGAFLPPNIKAFYKYQGGQLKAWLYKP